MRMNRASLRSTGLSIGTTRQQVQFQSISGWEEGELFLAARSCKVWHQTRHCGIVLGTLPNVFIMSGVPRTASKSGFDVRNSMNALFGREGR